MKKIFFSLLAAIFFLGNSGSGYAGEILSPNNITKPSIENFKAAPRIYFSNQAPIAGIALEGTVFDIDPVNGGFLYLVVDNYPNNFSYDQLQIKVYKSVNGQSQKYDEQVYNISTSNYFTYIKYSFYSTGYYIFDVYSKTGAYLGTAKVTINSKNSSNEASQSGYNASDPFAKSKVYFSTEVPFLGIARDVKSFKINSNGGFIYVIIDNYPNNFNVSSLRLTMYKLVNGNYVLQDDANYNINANNYFTYFKYNMYSAGDYKFVFYDAQNRYVNTGYVTITW